MTLHLTPSGSISTLRPPGLARPEPTEPPIIKNVYGLERRVARAVRIVAGKAAEINMTPRHPEYPDWLMRECAAALEHVHTLQPNWQAKVDVEGPTNKLLHRFPLPLGSRYVSDELHHIAKSSALGELETARQRDAHHPDEPRLAYLTPAGLVVDQVRVEREDLADTPLCAWMRVKVQADTAAGTALARNLGVPFVGVRVLLLGAPRRSVLAVSTAGRLHTQPLPDLTLLPARVGQDNVIALPAPRPLQQQDERANQAAPA